MALIVVEKPLHIDAVPTARVTLATVIVRVLLAEQPALVPVTV